MQIAYIFYII